MKAVIMTLGSRGDVQPYVALAKEMKKRGHEAIICTGESFKGFIEENGIKFAKVYLDIMAMVKTPEGKAVLEGGSQNVLKTIKLTKEVLNPAFRKSFNDFWQNAQGADVIIYHPKALVAVDIAEMLNIPCVSIPLVPMTYPITEFPNLAISPTGDFGKRLNRLSYSITKLGDIAFMREINDFRVKTLKIEKRKAGAYTYQRGGKHIPIIYPVSPSLFANVKSWEGKVFLSGFFHLETEQKLEQNIMDFISKGEKPVVISFSSMPLKNPDFFMGKMVEAVINTGNRAIIISGESGMQFDNDDDIMMVKQVPHDILFPHAKGIIHHGGIGTTAIALRSGVPQLIIPFSVDQPFWANRLYKMGYALKPLNEKKMTVSELIFTLKEMENIDNVKRAVEIQNIIAQEDGAGAACNIIEKLCV